MSFGFNKDTLGPLAFGGAGAYTLSNGANGLIGETISKISSVLNTDIIGGIDGFDILGGGVAGLIANKKFGANKTTSLMTSLLTTGVMANNSVLLGAGGGALLGKISGMALNSIFHGNNSEEEKDKLENFMTLVGGGLGTISVGAIASLSLGGLSPLALGAAAYGGYKLALPTIKKTLEMGGNGIKNTVNWTNGQIQDISEGSKKMIGALNPMNLFRKTQPAFAKA